MHLIPDIAIKNVNLVDVNSEEVYKADIAIKGDKIIGLGNYDGRYVIDGENKFAVPAFIDAHVHVESSFLTLTQFAKLVLSKGTTTIIADPHEICNILGLNGLKLLIEESKALPLKTFFMIPSSVPASNLGTSGAVIGIKEIKEALKLPNILGLGEVMVHPEKDRKTMEKIKLCKGKIINGHAPGLRGEELRKYIQAGILDDHESLSKEEILEKISLGMKIMIREGSAASSPKEFYELIKKYPDKFMFCTDDKHVNDIIKTGHIDFNVRKAIYFGIDPIKAIKCATINTSKHFKLSQIGSLEQGKLADILLLKNLNEVEVSLVVSNGKIIWKDGKYLYNFKKFKYPKNVLHSIKHRKVSEKDFILSCKGKVRLNIIKCSEGSLFTKWLKKEVLAKGELLDLKNDILKISVIERYRKEGNISLGLINGFGLKRGAIASSLSHDCHNIIAVGTSDRDIAKAVNEIIKNCGGLIVVDKNVKALLKLPVAGLLSYEKFDKVAKKLERLEAEAKKLGCKLQHPFATLSFMALEVIPKLKITDKGIVDVERLKIINLFF